MSDKKNKSKSKAAIEKQHLLIHPKPRALLAAPVRYTYHVAYYFQDLEDKTGWGTIQISRNFAIRNADDIAEAGEFIRARNNFKQVLLFNWILL